MRKPRLSGGAKVFAKQPSFHEELEEQRSQTDYETRTSFVDAGLSRGRKLNQAFERAAYAVLETRLGVAVVKNAKALGEIEMMWEGMKFTYRSRT